jgi:hypothetical protein
LGIDSRLRSIAMGLQKMLVLTKESFLFGGLSPPNKKRFFRQKVERPIIKFIIY